MPDIEQLQNIEFNNQIDVQLDIGSGSAETWGDMTKCFKNISQAINETLYTANYLADKGFSSTLVTGASPVLSLSGDYTKGDPVCEFLDSIQYEIGAHRVSKIKMTRGTGILTCPVTLSGIAIAMGDSTAPNTVNVTIAFNGKPSYSSAPPDGE